MSEIKRRNKSEEPRGEETGEKTPRRQTRVTLTKDVSSKYRKIMPKDQPAGKAGPRAPRRKPGDDDSAPPARAPRAGRPQREDSEHVGFDRERRPAAKGPGRKPAVGGSRPPTRAGRPKSAEFERPAGDRERRPAPGGRRTAESGPGSGPRRSAPGGKKFESRGPVRRSGGPAPAAASKGPAPEVVLKAIVNRELPEASRQVKETQELILNSANEMLALTEVLEGIHQRLEEALDGVLDEHGHMKSLLTPLRDETARAREVVVGLYEKMSFQDLAGQRLLKVEDFMAALGRVLEGLSPAGRGRPATAPGKNPARPPKKAAGAKLKGPQAAGEGMGQNDIDQLLAGL